MYTLHYINNTFESYQQIVSLFERCKDKLFVNIPVKLTGWFSANMCAALGAVFDLLQNNLNQVELVHTDSGINNILSKNGFLSYFGHSKTTDNYHTTIPYLKLKPIDGKYFKNYVYKELLMRNELPVMTAAAKEAIAESIYEIFVNAQMHSQTQTIYTCGQYFPNKNKIEFTITDLGIGFKNNINKRFDTNLSAELALKWAVKDRNTTKTDTPGGIGLAKLIDFLKLNAGKLQIVSHEGFYEFNELNEISDTFVGEFPGTVVNLQFNTNDNQSYKLKEEVDINNIF